MSIKNKELKISVLTINAISIVSIIIGICGTIVFCLQNNKYPWVFLLAISVCSIILSAGTLIFWIYLAVKYRKKITIKDLLKTTFYLKTEPSVPIAILQIAITICTLILLILALIF